MKASTFGRVNHMYFVYITSGRHDEREPVVTAEVESHIRVGGCPMTLERRQLAKCISMQTGCSDELAYRAVGALFDAMRETLIARGRVEIRGFGTLEVKPTKGKPGARNPRTNEVIPVPPHYLARFRPGKALRESMKRKR